MAVVGLKINILHESMYCIVYDTDCRWADNVGFVGPMGDAKTY